MTEPTIKIPVGDWVDEYAEAEPDLSTGEAMIATHQQGGYKPQQMGRMAIIGRERGDVPEGMVPAPKLLLNTGGSRWFASFVRRHSVPAEMPSGNTYNVREFTGPVQQLDAGMGGEDESQYTDDEPAYVSSFDELAVQRAADYLMGRVPAFIMGRMKILAASDARELAMEVKEHLHGEIDRIWSLLFEKVRE